ncbi:MAG: mannonate dehydratase, partial [Bacteroidaceae bacterium]|nr:mannonate dehydratase [Bacteroidaceae bacterium]
MEKTWRWFGRQDKITLDMLRQIGVEGIVTALHDVPNGEIWSQEKVRDMRQYIENHGLRWSVVESLPVCESIKYGGKDRDELIEKYIQSLENLGREGIHTICYNFMPVLDWARTDLEHPNGDGTSSLFFSHAEFAYFDCKLLKRPGAEKDYSPQTLKEIDQMSHWMTAKDERRLVENIIVKTQGFVNGNITEDDEHPIEIFRSLLALYDGIDKEQLRENMKYFLDAIMPVCNRWDMNMCVHPDDPPLQI